MLNYIFLGPPGAGKGTMGEMLCERTGVIHLSTGQLLRDEMASGSELGQKVKSIIASGALVPDDIVTAMVSKRLTQNDIREHGCLLDGYPRTTVQADSLKRIFADNATELTAAVLVDADREILLGRLTARRMCSNKSCGAIFNLHSNKPAREGLCDRCGSALIQRSDDSEETALDRLRVYDQQTAPLIDYYRKTGKLTVMKSREIPVEQNFAALLAALKM
ncbi:MAG: adenylate kinase [Oligosphaeraceae bacterium]|nr:adenylate kinase [Oligosphaeraceae bacterium]